MQRIPVLIQKLAELSEKDKELAAIDVDLMLDYTRVLYADLLDLRKTLPSGSNVMPQPQPVSAPQPEPEVMAEPVVTANISEVPAVDIRTAIGINDKYLFISELFRDDRAAYDAAIKQLNTCSNLREALHYTDNELLNKYNWDKESPTVQSFYTLLSNCFPSM